MHATKLVVIEGASGTGKSTVVEALTAYAGWRRMRTPPEPLRSIRTKIETEASDELSLLFNLVGVKMCSDEWKRASVDTVVDRYYFSTFVYSQLQLTRDSSRAMLDVFNLETPTHIIVLETEEAERQRRLVARGDDDNAFRRKVNAISSDMYRRRFTQIFGDLAIFVDSSHRNPEDMASEIIKGTAP